MSHVETAAFWHRSDIQSGKWDKKRPTTQMRLDDVYRSAIARLWRGDTEGVVLMANYGKRLALSKEYVGKTLKTAMTKVNEIDRDSREFAALCVALKRICVWFVNSRSNLLHCPIRNWINLAVAVGQSDEEMAPLFQ